MPSFGLPSGFSRFMAVPELTFDTAATHVKGPWAEVTASIGASIECVMLSPTHRGSGRANYLLDVAIGAAGSETVVLSNVAFNNEGSVFARRNPFFAPLRLPEGARLSCRAQSSNASTTCASLGVLLLSTPFFNLPSMDDWDTYGADTATTMGVETTVSNTWTQVTASTRRDARWILVYVSGNSHTLNSDYATVVSVGIGAAGSETEMFNFEAWGCSTAIPQSGFCPKCISVPCNIPSGTRIAVKASVVGAVLNPNPSFVVCLGN